MGLAVDQACVASHFGLEIAQLKTTSPQFPIGWKTNLVNALDGEVTRVFRRKFDEMGEMDVT